MPTYNGVGKSAGPFNEPTSIAQQPNNGFIFLSDGYKNARVHKFSPDGQLVTSWGEPGNAQENRNTKNNPNHFHTPHGIGVYGDRVFVCDREHNRIQVFSQDGDFVDIWTMMERPTDMHIDKDGIVYISELEDHVSIRDVQGNEIGRFGSERSNEPGKFWGPHIGLGRLRGQPVRRRGAGGSARPEVRAPEVSLCQDRWQAGSRPNGRVAADLAVGRHELARHPA